jgi:hypothetical protein
MDPGWQNTKSAKSFLFPSYFNLLQREQIKAGLTGGVPGVRRDSVTAFTEWGTLQDVCQPRKDQ